MNQGYWGIQHVTGVVLVLGMLVTIADIVVVVIQRKVEGLEAAFRGVEGIGEDVAAFRTVGAFSAVLFVPQLLIGVALLVYLSLRASDA